MPNLKIAALWMLALLAAIPLGVVLIVLLVVVEFVVLIAAVALLEAFAAVRRVWVIMTDGFVWDFLGMVVALAATVLFAAVFS